MGGSAPRTLLLSHGTGEIRGAGEIFLRTLASHYPAGRLCRLIYVPRDPSDSDGSWLGFPFAAAPIVRQRSYRRFGETIGGLASLAVSEYIRLVQTPDLVRRAVEFGRVHHVEQVWAVLNSPHVIHTARHVAEQLRVPLTVMVWDPPERIADELKVHPWTRRALCDEFERVVRFAARVGAASDGMRAEYRQRYGVDSIVLIQGVDSTWVHAPAHSLVDPGRLIIGFAGSMYASDEFAALVAALSAAGWRVGDRDVTVRVLGRSIGLETTSGVRIEWLGWRPVLDVIEALSQVDVCYVPYWLDEAHRVASRLCFPNKIAIYLAAGRPLFVHAAEDASPAVFVSKYGVGVCCDSSRPEEILNRLAEVASDPASYAAMADACTSAIFNELSLSIFVQRFAQLMGARVEDLAPVGSVGVADFV